jgi:probable F420-dependent oxidoreductase
MKFGVALPNCTEGLEYPIPFANLSDVVELTVQCERLGYHSVLANDHLSTPNYVREHFAAAPRFYEPMVTLALCASRTSSIRLMTGVVVVPMRSPVLLAKQAATLDEASSGRLDLGVGVGAYIEEFRAVQPQTRNANRGEMVREGIESLRVLWTAEHATFHGTYYSFDDVSMFPKPKQSPMPIYSAGNAEGSIRRAAELGQGWMPAGLGPDRLASGVGRLRESAEACGRDPAEIEVAPQLVVSIAHSEKEAVKSFEASGVYRHLLSLHKSTLKGIDPAIHNTVNLIGTPDTICDRVAALQAAGADHLCGLLFVAETLPEMAERIELFATTVAREPR